MCCSPVCFWRGAVLCMPKQSIIGLVLETHIRQGGSICHWEFFAAKLLARPWEDLAKKVAAYYSGDLSPERPRWRALPHIRNLAYSQVYWWKNVCGASVRKRRTVLRQLRLLLLIAGGKGWTANFLSHPRLNDPAP